MKRTLRGVSSAAILAGLFGMPMAAWAQQVDTLPAQVDADVAQAPTDEDRVVVTGSLFSGTPIDDALPVETFSLDDLAERGSPSALDFAKSLSIAGPTRGSSNSATGGNADVQYNLRGLGADKTLTLLNGRRASENVNNMPAAAIARIDVLKDGAAVTYGADASGGVVNFVTRESFVGIEASARYKYIQDSDGDYGLSLLGGMGEGDSNFMFALEWEHTSPLNARDRSFVAESLNRSVNPAPWSSFSNLGVYTAFTDRPAYPGANGLDGNTRNGEFGTPVAGTYRDFTESSCEAIAGDYTPTACWINWAVPHYRLVDDQNVYRAFAQLNTALNDDVEFHVEGLYSQVKFQTNLSPGNSMIRGPARAPGSTFQIYVPRENPYFMEFANRSGLSAAPNFADVWAVSPQNYRMYGIGGSPFLGPNASINQITDNQTWRVASWVKGRLGDGFGDFRDVNFDFGVTYNQAIDYTELPGQIGYKIQQALNGFGGPSCNAADLDPLKFGTQNPGAAGTNGCLWYNPFASGTVKHWTLDLANPVYVPGAENSREVVDWINDPHQTESTSSDLTIDLIFSAETPFELPGGNLALAGGMQGRQFEYRENNTNAFVNGSIPCLWPVNFTSGVLVNGQVQPVPQTPRSQQDPLFTGCTADRPGPDTFRTLDPSDYSDQQQFSVFGEAQIPVFDNLNLQAAVRREEFSGGFGATVYKVSGKWDVWGPISLRGSYGTNYQAPPATLIPGNVTSDVTSVGRAASTWRGLITRTVDNVVPETATAWNAGVIWRSEGFAPEHDFTFIIDYFDIETENEIGALATIDDIADAVFSGAAVPGQPGFFYADCSSQFLTRVLLNDTVSSPGGTCVQGATHSDQLAVVTTDLGNGPGVHTAGFDVQSSYELAVGPGDLRLDFTGTFLSKLERSATILDGVTITPSDDRLGYLNYSGSADAAPKIRANAAATYRLDTHSVRLGVNYVSAVKDERPGVIYGQNGEEWIVADVTWLWDMYDDLRLSASVLNLFDRNPPRVQQDLGFDPLLGNALGRMFEVSVKKTF